MHGQRHAQAALSREAEPLPIVHEAGCSLGPVWTGAENIAPSALDPRKVQPAAGYYTDYAMQAAHG